jgi:mannose-6-phosphate isomerase-like protein (cupin superfamily)
MEFIDSKAFVADVAWANRMLMDLDTHTVKIHWTDKPYRWHLNTGEELFVVLDGVVEMHFLQDGEERIRVLEPGQMALVLDGESHVARPLGEARIMVIEQKGTE